MTAVCWHCVRSGFTKGPLDALKSLRTMEAVDVGHLAEEPAEGKELLDRLEDFGRSIGSFEEQVDKASGISRGQLEDSRDNVLEAYRKAYAERVVDPLFTDFLTRLHESDERFRSLDKVAETADVASLAAFLASDEAAYINGQTINIDGGAVPS